MSSAEDTPASPSPSLATDWDSMMSETSGPSSPEYLASYDPATRSWRTLQRTFDLDLIAHSPTLPTSGTMRNGQLYGDAPWVAHSHGPDCSRWPTHTASSWGATGSRGIVARRVADGTITEQEARQLVSGQNGRKNPLWVEWLMGFPPNWTAPATKPSVMPSSPKSPES